MASCLISDSSAVMMALKHIRELDKQLKEEGLPFFTEASLSLSEIAAAISELEADRRATREQLEVETIENSKLRHQGDNSRDSISQEMEDDIAAARNSNAKEIEQLHQDLKKVFQEQQRTSERQEVLLRQNEELHPEREKAKAEHEKIIAALNEQINLKYSLQNHLDQTHVQIEELKSVIAALKQDRTTVQQNMVQEREAFSVKRGSMSKEDSHLEEKIKQQRDIVSRCRKELVKVNAMKMEANELLGELTSEMEKLESNIQILTESRIQSSEELDEELQEQEALKQEEETLLKMISEVKEAHRAAHQSLKEEITIVEGTIDEGQASRSKYQETLGQSLDVFKRQKDEEKEAREEHLDVSQQLERSRLQLQGRIASIVKHSKEVNEMDKQILELVEEHTINRKTFERNQEEVLGNMDAVKNNICHFEEESKRLTELLEEEYRRQEEHEEKMVEDISSTRRRNEELLQEKAMLHGCQPESVDVDLMISYTQQCDDDYKQRESKCQEEIDECVAQTEMIIGKNREKQHEVEDEEVKLKEVEEKWSEDKSRYQQVKEFFSGLNKKKSDLEWTIEDLKERTASLLQPKEDMKALLEELKRSHMDMLQKQAVELRAVETSIYDSRVLLEQVAMENSRLRLCMRQMTEDIDRTRRDTRRHHEEAQRFMQETSALVEELQEAWREDLLMTRSCGDGLVLTSALLERLKCRRQQLEAVSSLLHQHMLNFSRRLGDSDAAEQ